MNGFNEYSLEELNRYMRMNIKDKIQFDDYKTKTRIKKEYEENGWDTSWMETALDEFEDKWGEQCH